LHAAFQETGFWAKAVGHGLPIAITKEWGGQPGRNGKEFATGITPISHHEGNDQVPIEDLTGFTKTRSLPESTESFTQFSHHWIDRTFFVEFAHIADIEMRCDAV
jgi:hypothetical protein